MTKSKENDYERIKRIVKQVIKDFGSNEDNNSEQLFKAVYECVIGSLLEGNIKDIDIIKCAKGCLSLIKEKQNKNE